MASNLESELKRISSHSCPSGETHEATTEKTEECPDGTVKYMVACRKCMAQFEVEV